ncbi:MAG: YfhO family protein [Anaerolineae bacterium]|nr:YfhO family protein [Anaerolineae bacterium]
MKIKIQEFVDAKDVCCVIVLCVIAALFLWPAWLQPNSFWYPPNSEFSDITATHWPKMTFVVESVRTYGQIPLWIPPLLGGMPFVGNPLAGYFYPFNWLVLLLPVTLAFHILFALDILVAGITFYGLMRWSYGRSAYAAFIGSVGFMLTSKFIGHIGAGHMGWCQAFSWLPLTLWLLRSAIHRRCAYRAVWCGAIAALTLVADPRVAFYNVTLQGLYALYRLVGLWHQEGWRKTLNLALKLLLVPVVMVLIGAGQMLPMLELMSSTVRSELTLQDAAFGSLPRSYLLGYVISDWAGYFEWMTYLGLAPLGLAVLALWRRIDGLNLERWFWGGLVAFCILFALGSNAPLYPLVFRLLPFLGWVRVPPRALLLVTLAVNILASMGVDGLLRQAWGDKARRWMSLVAFAGVLFCMAVGVGFALLMGDELPPAVVVFSAVGAVLAVWLFAFSKRLVSTPILQVVLVIVVLSDLYAVGHSLLVLHDGAQVLAENEPAAAYVAARSAGWRVYSPSYSIGHHVAARFGIEQLDGLDPLQLRWMAGFMALAGNYEIVGYPVMVPVFPEGDENWQMSMQGVVPDTTLLGLVSAKYIVAEFPVKAPGLVFKEQAGSSYIYENERAMPRAFIVTQTQVVVDWQDALDHLAAGFDPLQPALVEAGHVLDGPASWQAASITLYSPNRIVVKADAIHPSLLVLSEVWYPGWQATANGIELPIYRVNGVMRGVYLEPGTHTVEWRYRPASLRWGIMISLFALLGLGAGGVAIKVSKNADRKA